MIANWKSLNILPARLGLNGTSSFSLFILGFYFTRFGKSRLQMYKIP